MENKAKARKQAEHRMQQQVNQAKQRLEKRKAREEALQVDEEPKKKRAAEQNNVNERGSDVNREKMKRKMRVLQPYKPRKIVVETQRLQKRPRNNRRRSSQLNPPKRRNVLILKKKIWIVLLTPIVQHSSTRVLRLRHQVLGRA